MLSAVIGDPVVHSLSPAIHRAGYRINSLDWSYRAQTVRSAELREFIGGCRADPRWAGLSVTAPHKQAVVALGQADHLATLTSAGNTVVFGQEPHIYNTDVPGFVRAWRHHQLDEPVTALLIGAGATARSILVALAGLNLRQVTIVAREPKKASSLLELAVALGIDARAQPLHFVPDEVDVLASTIPAEATQPHAARWAEVAHHIFDVVYDPWPTPLVQAAHDDQSVLTGLDLLAGQAVDQFHLLTGASITFEQALAAAKAELQRRQLTPDLAPEENSKNLSS